MSAIPRTAWLENILVARNLRAAFTAAPVQPSQSRSNTSGLSGVVRAWVMERKTQTVLLCIGLAALLRLSILVSSQGMMDGDEAVLGLQAERILHGEFPIYFTGQSYMGSWDAYLAAPLIALFGPSAGTLHAITFLESLLLVPLMGALAGRLFGDKARLYAMLLTALPPLYVAVGELRMLGGYVETLVLGSALMLGAISIVDRWSQKRATRWIWALCGLLLGLAFWIDLLIICYLATVVIWILPFAIVRIRQWPWRDIRAHLPLAGTAGLFTLAFFVGALPALIYIVTTDGYLAPFIANPGGDGQPSALRLSLVKYFFNNTAPRISGVIVPWNAFDGAPLLGTLIGMLVGGLTILACVYATAQLFSVAALRLKTRAEAWSHLARIWRHAFPLLLALMTLLVFWRSPTTNFQLLPDLDAVGRYALPLTTGLTLLLVQFMLSVAGLPQLRHRLLKDRNADRADRSEAPSHAPWRAQVVSGALLVTLLVAFAIPYVTADHVLAMQSPYAKSLRFPAVGGDVTRYLEDHDIRYVWADHWVGTVLMYLTSRRVLAADYFDTVLAHGPNRFPEVFAAVSDAPRPSFVAAADDNTHEPWEAQAMRNLGVQFMATHFESVWVLTPVSRDVRPLELLTAMCATPALAAPRLWMCAYVSLGMSPGATLAPPLSHGPVGTIASTAPPNPLRDSGEAVDLQLSNGARRHAI
jgi:hypothetical protein